MCNKNMKSMTLKQNSGFAHIAALVLLLVGLMAGVILVQRPSIFFTKALPPPNPAFGAFTITGTGGGTVTQTSPGTYTTDTPAITIEITNIDALLQE